MQKATNYQQTEANASAADQQLERQPCRANPVLGTVCRIDGVRRGLPEPEELGGRELYLPQWVADGVTQAAFDALLVSINFGLNLLARSRTVEPAAPDPGAVGAVRVTAVNIVTRQ